jgi:hypothetical protein
LVDAPSFEINKSIIINRRRKKKSIKWVSKFFVIFCFLIFIFLVILPEITPALNERKRVSAIQNEALITNNDCYYDFDLKANAPYYVGEDGYIICGAKEDLLNVKPPWIIATLHQVGPN